MVWYGHNVCLRSVVERWKVLHAAWRERIAVLVRVRACPQCGLLRLQRAGGKYRFRDTVAADEVIRLVVKKKVGGAAGVEPAGHDCSVTWALRASLYEVGVGAENGSVLPDELLCSLLRLLAHTLRCAL